MNQQEIYDKLKTILATVKPKMDPSRISMDASLTTDLGIDSLSMLLLSLAIEHEFGFQFQTQQPFKTVREVVEYIERAV